MKRLLIFLFFIPPIFISAQNVAVTMTLFANEGGPYANLDVSLQDTISKATFKGTTDYFGDVTISVPAKATYEFLADNYTGRYVFYVPDSLGNAMSATLFYSNNMKGDDKVFAMNEVEKKHVDEFAESLPDTTWFNSTTNPFAGVSTSFYAKVKLEITDFNGLPLVGEMITLVGRKRQKAFKGVTNENGKLMVFLPKGDDYDLSFLYNKNYEFTECKYSKGTSDIDWSFDYIGTKTIAQQMLATKHPSNGVNEVSLVMDRNKFKNPLIICDVTANMQPIMDDLQSWFASNEKVYPDAQFVFFNDGDNKPDSLKKPGETGGVYYTPTIALDKLSVFMMDVSTKGTGGDKADNYMEAIIKGTKMAKPYTDIVLLADNHATVSDMSLLESFNQPVHIIIFCSIKAGCIHSFVQPDYLKIAWKTKGTIHNDNKDYNDIGSMKEGDTIDIGTGTFKLQGGEFVKMK